MATQVPPLRGAAFTYETALVSQADSALFQVNPTLAAGDVIIYKDGVLDGNADNLPAAVGASSIVTHTLSAAEMTADRITIIYKDVAGAEWQDVVVNVHTVTTSQIDDLATAVALATVDGIVDDVLIDTNELQTDDIPGTLSTITGTLSTIDGIVDAILADTDELQTDDVPGLIAALNDLIAALNDLSAAEVNAEMLDVMNVDTFAEPGQGAPPATATLVQKLGYLFKAFRNKIVQDATTMELYNDAGTVVDQKATVSDDGTDFTRGKIGSGP